VYISGPGNTNRVKKSRLRPSLKVEARSIGLYMF